MHTHTTSIFNNLLLFSNSHDTESNGGSDDHTKIVYQYDEEYTNCKQDKTCHDEY